MLFSLFPRTLLSRKPLRFLDPWEHSNWVFKGFLEREVQGSEVKSFMIVVSVIIIIIIIIISSSSIIISIIMINSNSSSSSSYIIIHNSISSSMNEISWCRISDV